MGGQLPWVALLGEIEKATLEERENKQPLIKQT